FFFQAEDGIRDFHVTGVQTCALPISGRWRRAGHLQPIDRALRAGSRRRDVRQVAGPARRRRRRVQLAVLAAKRGNPRLVVVDGEIGRASCRERVEGRGGGGGRKE